MTASQSHHNEIESPLDEIRDHTLPEDLLPIIDRYEEVVGHRDWFLWKWAHYLFPKFTLSCVDPIYVNEIRDAKLVGLVFVSILDDIAEMRQDPATFEEVAKIPFSHKTVDPERTGIDREVLAFANDVWKQFAPTLEESPRSAEFKEIVEFDLEQMVNSMRYSYVANQDIELVTGSELQTYDAHNMMMYGFADIDILHSPTFDHSEISMLRRVVDRAQRMVRIGNWITTWERELLEGDFTSGVVVYALENDIVSTDELATIRERPDAEIVDDIVARIRDQDVEDVFLTQWREELARARRFQERVETVDIKAYLDGIETVMEYHLATRGLK